MPAGLLERRDDLRVLRAALDRARSGNGGAALVAGEAGIGKTSLVRRFVAELPGDVRVLVGVCDDLLAPRALGPLQEAVAARAGPSNGRSAVVRRRCSTPQSRSSARPARRCSSSTTCSGPTTRPSTCCATSLAASTGCPPCWC